MRQRLEELAASLQLFHATDKQQAPRCAVVDHRGHRSTWLAWRLEIRAVFHVEHTRRGQSMIDVFVLHVLRVRHDRAVSREQLEAIALLTKQAHHRHRVQSAATARVVLRQAPPAKTPITRLDHRALERLRTADAFAVVVVCEEHCRRNVEGASFDMRIEQPVRIEQLRMPLRQLRERSLEPQVRNRPRRRAGRRRDQLVVGWCVDLVPQRDLMSGPLQMRHQRAEIGACPANAAIAPVEDGDAHQAALNVLRTRITEKCSSQIC